MNYRLKEIHRGIRRCGFVKYIFFSMFANYAVRSLDARIERFPLVEEKPKVFAVETGY
jgi:hypothetical protein